MRAPVTPGCRTFAVVVAVSGGVVGCRGAVHSPSASVGVPAPPARSTAPPAPPDDAGSTTRTGFVWEQRVPQGQKLLAVWGSASSDVWAVGAGGACVHYDGRSWRTVPLPSMDRFDSVWGTGPRDVWAAGVQSIFHYDGSRWTPSYKGERALNLERVWGRSPTDVWAVGGFGNTGAVLLHYDGTRWSPIENHYFETWNSIWPGPHDTLVLATAGGAVRVYDGSVFTDGAPGPKGLARATATAEGALGVTRRGEVARFDGRAWSIAQAGTERELADIWVDSIGNAWAVGEAIVGKDGAAWAAASVSYAPGNTGTRLNGVFGTAPNDVWAVGKSGTIVHYDGRTWSESSSGASTTWNGVARVREDEVWAVGAGMDPGVVLRRQRGVWRPIPAPEDTIHAIHANGPDDVWLAGGKDLYHWDGHGFEPALFHSGPSEGGFTGVWAAGSRAVGVGLVSLAVLDNGRETERAMNQIQNLTAVWGSSASDVWAVGPEATVRHHDGARWNDVPSPAKANWFGVWGTAEDDVWLVGLELTRLFGSAVIAHFDGKEFRVERPEDTLGLRAVFGSARTDVWAVGTSGTVVHFDGATWSRVDAGVDVDFTGGLAEPDGTVWLTGPSALLRRDAPRSRQGAGGSSAQRRD